MRVYEAISETLKKLEVQATFVLMGDGNLRFMTYLAYTSWLFRIMLLAMKVARSPWPMAMRGERPRRRLQRHAGPGRHQYVTALTEARKASSPLSASCR